MTHTLPEFLLHWAERTHDAVFVTEPDRGRTWTYGQVAGAVGRFRARLRGLRVARGDRVAILAENSCVWVVAYLGTLAHGAIAVPLNTRHASGDLDRVLDGVDPVAVIGDPPYLARLAERHRRRIVASADVDVSARPVPAPDGSDARPADVGVLCYTSGTTGAPRGVMIRNESLVRNAAMFAHIFQSGPDTATAVVCPLFHNTGYNDGLAHMLLANGRVDIARRFDPGAIAPALLEGRYTFLIGVPTIYSRLLPLLEAAPPSTVSAPWLAYGGAPMPGPLAARLAEVVPGVRFVNVYGMSEATSVTHYLPWRPGVRDLTAIGVPVPGIRDRLTPDGELQVDTPTAMVGYWQDDSATRARFDGPWLRTGDLARRGGDGLLRITGRVDELINRGGEKVAPLEVESAISAHPDVMEASVVGLPDHDLGEIVGAAVVARAGSALDAGELGRFLAERIADYKSPRKVRFLPTLPRNPNGKVLRDEVRRLLDEG
jgi:acyl-CoA synthetase (AMP-forming)/AMP-acid ligase II